MSANELRKPDGAASGPHADSAIELMRAWGVGDRLQFVLRPALRNPQDVGRMLGEAAQHFAKVYASAGAGDAQTLLKDIYAGWDHAQANPIMAQMTVDAKDDEAAQ